MEHYKFEESFIRGVNPGDPYLIVDKSANAIYVYIDDICYIFVKEKK